MKKNGRTTAGSQRWKCTACSPGSVAHRQRERRERQLAGFLGWLLGSGPQALADPSGDSRALRKRTAWCWDIRPAAPPVTAKHHTVMADGWCLIVAIDGDSGEVLGRRWCAHESRAAYITLFSRIPAPDVLITDGLRGVRAACRQAWPGTRI